MRVALLVILGCLMGCGDKPFVLIVNDPNRDVQCVAPEGANGNVVRVDR